MAKNAMADNAMADDTIKTCYLMRLPSELHLNILTHVLGDKPKCFIYMLNDGIIRSERSAAHQDAVALATTCRTLHGILHSEIYKTTTLGLEITVQANAQAPSSNPISGKILSLPYKDATLNIDEDEHGLMDHHLMVLGCVARAHPTLPAISAITLYLSCEGGPVEHSMITALRRFNIDPNASVWGTESVSGLTGEGVVWKDLAAGQTQAMNGYSPL